MSATEHLLRRHALAMLAAAAHLSMGWAQAPSGATVTEADIDRAHRSQPAITDRDIEQAQRAHRVPNDVEVSRLQGQAPPRIEALPQPDAGARRQTVDLGALAESFADQMKREPRPGPDASPRLLVFISLSMPEPTLTRLLRQTAQAGGVLLIRGLVKGSLRETVSRMQALIKSQRVAAQIDPQAFERHAVKQVPSFVVARGTDLASTCKGAACLPISDFVLVAGDVSLDHALAHIDHNAPAFSRDARLFLERLQR